MRLYSGSEVVAVQMLQRYKKEGALTAPSLYEQIYEMLFVEEPVALVNQTGQLGDKARIVQRGFI